MLVTTGRQSGVSVCVLGGQISKLSEQDLLTNFLSWSFLNFHLEHDLTVNLIFMQR